MDTKTFLKTLFPSLTDFGRGGEEANGLAKDTYPQNCETLATGQCMFASRRGERREWFLVRTSDGTMGMLRVCQAMPGCGYDEFAVLHRIARGAEECEELERYARDYIATVCEPHTLQ